MLRLPELDDRTWADLMEEAQALIPTLNTDWTDHNPSDPGIILLELFAWLAEMVIYRVNEVPEENYWTFLKLLAGQEVDRSAGLEEAIRSAVLDLRTRYRAVTPQDFEGMTIEQWPIHPDAMPLGWRREVARVLCVPERNLTRDVDAEAPGHVSLVVMPRRPVLTFDGQDEYLSCAVDPYLRLTGDLTVSAWICPGNVPKGFQPILTRGGEFSLVLHDTGLISLGHGADPVGPWLEAMRTATGHWTHVAISRNTATRTLAFYLDGQPVGTQTYGEEPIQDTGPVRAAGTPESTCNFEGQLIDACVWRRVRTAEEIAAELSTPPRPGTKDLIVLLTDRFSPGWTSSEGLRLDDPALYGPIWHHLAHGDLLGGLKRYFDQRRLVTTRVQLLSPRFVEVSIEATLYLRMDGQAATVRERADQAIRALFDPLTGWRDRRGWPFGRSLYLSDLYTALEGVEGVDYIKGARLSAAPERELFPADAGPEQGTIPFGIDLKVHELPILTSVRLTLMEMRRSEWREVTL